MANYFLSCGFPKSYHYPRSYPGPGSVPFIHMESDLLLIATLIYLKNIAMFLVDFQKHLVPEKLPFRRIFDRCVGVASRAPASNCWTGENTAPWKYRLGKDIMWSYIQHLVIIGSGRTACGPIYRTELCSYIQDSMWFYIQNIIPL